MPACTSAPWFPVSCFRDFPRDPRRGFALLLVVVVGLVLYAASARDPHAPPDLFDGLQLVGAKAEIARELAYRLYTLCERKKRAAEALAYNGLVRSWPEILRLARQEVLASANPCAIESPFIVARRAKRLLEDRPDAGPSRDAVDAAIDRLVDRA